MSTIVTRSGKGSTLTHAEVDANFSNLNTDKAGYAAGIGEGGAVTQATSKSTGVTLNKKCGKITLHNASLVAGAVVSFTLTNSTVGVNDVIALNHSSAGTFGAYQLSARAGAGATTIAVGNATTGTLAEAIVLTFVVIKGAVD
jgi:hypothetical protein